jgi:D-alanine--poly(phosphoribitol) ligase subunit 1
VGLQRNAIEYLEKTAAIFPDKVAFADENTSVTFSELKSMSEALGSEISRLTEKINRPIAVFTDRTVASIAAFLGVLYSGNYYVPIDSHMPVKRIESILTQLEPELLLCDTPESSMAQSFANLCPVLSLRDGFKSRTDRGRLEAARMRVLDIDPVYVIYTSGSTGTPKGIVISHRSLLDFIEWMANACNFTSDDILANQAPFYFDLSVKDIYITLKCGTTTHILSRKRLMFPMPLMEYLQEKGVTTLIWATSAFNLVANSGILSSIAPKSIKKVILGGETLHGKQLNIWRSALPEVKYINLYGPTEVTVDCTYYIIDRPYSDNEAIPIGRACENMEVMLLDEDLKPVPPGQTGEICVRGIGLARGYYGDSEKTRSAFVQNPFNNKYPDIIYRTGDMGTINSDGLLVFLSRKDGQIKHMGYRIELGEVETAIIALDSIRAAACFFDEKRDKIVCAYEGELTGDDIIRALRTSLPKYMFPNIFKKMEKMPYNANGKIDRVLLKEMYFNGTDKEL